MDFSKLPSEAKNSTAQQMLDKINLQISDNLFKNKSSIEKVDDIDTQPYAIKVHEEYPHLIKIPKSLYTNNNVNVKIAKTMKGKMFEEGDYILAPRDTTYRLFV